MISLRKWHVLYLFLVHTEIYFKERQRGVGGDGSKSIQFSIISDLNVSPFKEADNSWLSILE